MTYNEDQCVQCGGIRVAGSTLCADCLVALVNTSVRKNIDNLNKITHLEEKNRKLTRLVERLLDHIVQEAAYSDELQQARYLKWLEKEGGG
jgi:hypothetical protein